MWAASTCPSALAESLMSSTAKARAMLDIRLPRVLTNREEKYHAKLRLRSGANEAAQVIAAPRARRSGGRPRR